MNISVRFYENVKFIARNKGINLKEIERTIGVTQGYMSRAKKNNIDISISKAYTAAKMLGYTLDDLIEKDYAKEFRRAEIKKEIARLEAELMEADDEKED